MNRSFARSRTARSCPSSRCNGRGSFWPAQRACGLVTSPLRCNVMRPRSGGTARATDTSAWPGCWTTSGRGDRVGPPPFPPLQRAQIVELACLEPVAKGLHITHWSSEDLARQAVADGIVAHISPRTVRNILSAVDLQPHRTRYWKTARLDARFKERAEQVLWCYANTPRLAERGIWVVCVDEIPTFQVLERNPIRRAIPGSIEQQEFDYTRHGTVNMLVLLVVHSGLMELAFLANNDAEHYLPELELFHRQHKELRGVFLIQDGGPSHIAGGTRKYFAGSQGWWRARYTPANASWLHFAKTELIRTLATPGFSESPGRLRTILPLCGSGWLVVKSAASGTLGEIRTYDRRQFSQSAGRG